MTANAIFIIIYMIKTALIKHQNKIPTTFIVDSNNSMTLKLFSSIPSQICHTIYSKGAKHNNAREQYGNESFIPCG
jgi:hypothetical protein